MIVPFTVGQASAALAFLRSRKPKMSKPIPKTAKMPPSKSGIKKVKSEEVVSIFLL
jgi:hypothetical protein